MKVFLDTNVLLDFLVVREDAQLSKDAASLLDLGVMGELDLYMSVLSVPTIAYVLKKMSSDRKREIIGKIASIVKILPSTGDHVQQMLESPIDDIEDALQLQSARQGSCDVLISRDRDFQKANLPSFTPEEFLRKLFS